MPCIMGFLANKHIPRLNLDNTSQTDSPKLKSDPDEKWSNLYRERQRNNLYKWVNNTPKGGELLQVFEDEGENGLFRFVQEKIIGLLYNDGVDTEIIKLAEFTKWKKTMTTNLAGKEEIALTDITDNFVEHRAQWRLNKRGIEGETLIHLLLNRDDPKSTDIAKLLIHEFPGLALDIYEGEEMFGQSALHIAIVHDDYDCVCLLLEKGADVSQRATGKFFLPDDQKTATPKKQSNYQGFAYYGEYPIAFAACFGNKDIYDVLIQHGADPNRQDILGNTVLHMCVINNSIEMYGYAVRHWAKPADVNVVNNQGQTPLTLASKLGRREIFEEMLELMKVEFWRFSDMACSAYPLTALDTIKPDGSTNWDSALMTVINGNTPAHMDMVGSEVIQRLLADKWKAYGSRKMYERLMLLLVHLLCMSIAVYLRPKDGDSLLSVNDQRDYVRFVAEIITVGGCLFFIFIQQGGEMKAQGMAGYFRSLRTAPDKCIFFIVNILIVLCVPWRLAGHTMVEEASLVLALPGSWMFLLFFARGALLTGPFVQMIYSMIAGDILRFLIVACIFLVSFSQAFYFVGKDMEERQYVQLCDVSLDDHHITSYSNFLETVMTLVRASVGSYEYDDFDCAHYVALIKIMSVLYMIIMPIMLVNMLIAMMGNTYTRVISQAEKAWRQQWAQIVVILERALSKDKLAKFQTEYSIKIGDDKDTGMETRGLMVIKQTKKTKARQRKQAVNNWKRLCRKVAQQMRQKKLHPEDQMGSRLNSARPKTSLRSIIQNNGEVFTSVERRMSLVLNAMASQETFCKTPQLTVHHTADSPVEPKNLLKIGKQWTVESADSVALPPLFNKEPEREPTLQDGGENIELRSTVPKQIQTVVEENATEAMDISSPHSAASSPDENVFEGEISEVKSADHSATKGSLPTPRVTVETLPNMPQSSRVIFENVREVEKKPKKVSKKTSNSTTTGKTDKK